MTTRTGLRGKTVLLRAVERADIETLRAFVNDPDVMVFSNVYRPISDVEQAAWFETAVRRDVWFAVDDVKTGRLIGTCCLVETDWIARQTELRIRIGDKDAWGGGRGTEACTLLLKHAFEQMNLARVWLRVFETNPRAQKVYEKLGFVVEGRLRRAACVNGELRDVVIMGLLRDEWRAASLVDAAKK